MADHLTHIVLFSGDGDFRRLVEAVQRKGVRVTVVSTVRSQPSMVADELRRQADAFMDLLDLQEQIERELPRDHPRARSETGFADEEEADFEEDEDLYESGTA
jgi:uncharacterized LabA/DUF88 family protein